MMENLSWDEKIFLQKKHHGNLKIIFDILKDKCGFLTIVEKRTQNLDNSYVPFLEAYNPCSEDDFNFFPTLQLIVFIHNGNLIMRIFFKQRKVYREGIVKDISRKLEDTNEQNRVKNLIADIIEDLLRENYEVCPGAFGEQSFEGKIPMISPDLLLIESDSNNIIYRSRQCQLYCQSSQNRCNACSGLHDMIKNARDKEVVDTNSDDRNNDYNIPTDDSKTVFLERKGDLDEYSLEEVTAVDDNNERNSENDDLVAEKTIDTSPQKFSDFLGSDKEVLCPNCRERISHRSSLKIHLEEHCLMKRLKSHMKSQRELKDTVPTSRRINANAAYKAARDFITEDSSVIANENNEPKRGKVGVLQFEVGLKESYKSLIADALKSSSTGQLRVSEIYDYIYSKHPKLAENKAKVGNHIRHTLTVCKTFCKAPEPKEYKYGKGGYWMIDPNPKSHSTGVQKNAVPKKSNQSNQNLMNLICTL